MRYTILVFPFLVACGVPPAFEPAPVDPELVPHFETFQNEVGGEVSDISGEFDDLDTTKQVAFCQVKGLTRRIVVDRGYWSRLSPESREALMLHELGHCSKGLGHVNALQGPCPASVMHPQVLTPHCYNANSRAAYVQQLRDAQ